MGRLRRLVDEPPTRRFRYNPSIDGIRGLGVIVVVLGHVGGGAGFGKYGLFPYSVLIDMFFIVSGYLITTLLLEEWSRSSEVSLRSFYVRRFLRLMPALFALLALVVVVAVGVKLLGATYPPFKTTLAEVGAAAFYVYPVIVLVKQGETFLFHLWTLSVEEWFYFLWPALLVRIGLRRHNPRGPVIAVAMLACVVLACAAVRIYADTIPYSTIVENKGAGAASLVLRLRPESLAVGSLLAFFFRWWPTVETEGRRRVAVVVSGIGWVCVWLTPVILPWPDSHGVSYTAWQDLAFRHISYRIGMVLALLSIVHLVLAPDGPIGRALTWKPLVRVGVLSYGVYLWHQPLFLLFREWVYEDHPFNGGLLFAGVLAASIAVAELSYRLIETPALRQKKRFERVAYKDDR